MEIWKTPKKVPRKQRIAVFVFLFAGIGVLAYVAVSQHSAVERAKEAMDYGTRVADAIVELGREEPAQVQNLAWEVSREVRAGSDQGALGSADLARISDLVREARAASSSEAKRQALEQIARIVEQRIDPLP